VLTGIGSVAVRQPRVRDRAAAAGDPAALPAALEVDRDAAADPLPDTSEIGRETRRALT
jgi:hypothetical protein